MAIVTRDEVRGLMMIPEALTRANPRIDQLIPETEGRVSRYLNGRTLLAADHDRVLDGTGRQNIRLPEWPINSVTGVWMDSTRVFGELTAVAATQFQIRKDSGMLRLLTGFWPLGAGNVRVLWNAGWPANAFPADIKQAITWAVACMLVRSLQLEGGGGAGELTSEALGGESSADYNGEMDNTWGLPKLTVAALRHYRMSI